MKILLTESRINAGALNLRGQNPLHVLASYPKDNAAAIAEIFLETMPDYNLNAVDVEGNSGGWVVLSDGVFDIQYSSAI